MLNSWALSAPKKKFRNIGANYLEGRLPSYFFGDLASIISADFSLCMCQALVCIGKLQTCASTGIPRLVF